jgi:hypothetical protein
MEQASGTASARPAAGEEALPVGVHLVGSIPLPGSEEVFRLSAEILGDRLRRLPDGETGSRSDWIAWQYPVFSACPEFETGPAADASYGVLSPLRLRRGEPAGPICMGDLGYAREAIESYGTFARLKNAGEIPQGCRFLLSLPTPLAPVSAFVAAEDQATLEPVYESRMLREVERVLAAIPADELAIQWDARYEFAMLEGAVGAWFEDVRTGVVERLVRLSGQVPQEVELGYHLCYGDDEHGHFVEPEDSRKLVEVANALATALERPLDWVHMPVPEHRSDDGWFAPMGELTLGPKTELYLGLLHPELGREATLERIAVARRHVDGFGVATECGWGRGSEADVRGLLELHRGFSAPVRAA